MHRAQQQQQQPASWPRFTLGEVAARRLVVIGREVFDLARFAARHPGGPGAAALLGTDGTRQFLAAHAKSGLALRILSRVKVGEVDERSLPAEDRALSALEARLRADGLFDYPRRLLLLDLASVLGPFLLALALVPAAERLGGAGAALLTALSFALLCLATLHQTYLAHDVRHDAVLGTEEAGRRLVDRLGVLVFGATLNPMADEHRMHHAFPNCLGLDEALNLPPLVFHRRQLPRLAGRTPRQRRALRALLLRAQLPLFLLVVLPLTYPYMVLAGARYLLRRRQYLLLGAAALRFLLLGLWLKSLALLLLPPVLVTAFQALLSSLNHYHRRIAAGPGSSSVRTLIERSQNTGPGALWTWLCGGLNYHIEHHLFPTMPRRHYPRVALRVQALCAEQRIPYHSCGRAQALRQMLDKLRHPLRPAVTP